MTDTQQDLVGDRYLSEQIRIINQENQKKSVLDKWSHLLYEGDKDYGSNRVVMGNLGSVSHAPTPVNTTTTSNFFLNNNLDSIN